MPRLSNHLWLNFENKFLEGATKFYKLVFFLLRVYINKSINEIAMHVFFGDTFLLCDQRNDIIFLIFFRFLEMCVRDHKIRLVRMRRRRATNLIIRLQSKNRINFIAFLGHQISMCYACASLHRWIDRFIVAERERESLSWYIEIYLPSTVVASTIREIKCFYDELSKSLNHVRSAHTHTEFSFFFFRQCARVLEAHTHTLAKDHK